jgi:Na+/H+ antiporter NhaD/arsenite permease-like protein
MSLTRRSAGLAATASLLLLTAPGYGAAAQTTIPPVELWLTAPFVLLLAAIALGPFVHRERWERFYPAVSIGLGFAVAAYYSINLDYHRMLAAAAEYASFIALIGSLFVAAGGIYLHAERHATPFSNVTLLAIGAVAANLLGTTGASMLLIRPFVRINKPRIRPYHVVFFIFIVSNMGGALTPIGDPPLFLGYLYGVPFHWTLKTLWPVWLLANGLVLATFFVTDLVSYSRWLGAGHRPAKGSMLEIRGLQNFVFLFIILASVFATSPVREVIMVAAAFASYRFARKEALRANGFTFAPIREVAILFAGIFATMVPALDWLALNAPRLGLNTPGGFYWASGTLSSVLDNAPTYLNFLSAALGLHGLVPGNHEHIRILVESHAGYLKAISIGSVFFGAMTYIGNGPNFMVKSIAESAGVECPSFMAYVLRYSLPILLPVFTLVWFVFFR